ncbi:MAG: hypothetical protein N2645_02030 [Clostridia bacterium]|nr:hypothetical protein [Clostridia bacterium]
MGKKYGIDSQTRIEQKGTVCYNELDYNYFRIKKKYLTGKYFLCYHKV